MIGIIPVLVWFLSHWDICGNARTHKNTNPRTHPELHPTLISLGLPSQTVANSVYLDSLDEGILTQQFCHQLRYQFSAPASSPSLIPTILMLKGQMGNPIFFLKSSTSLSTSVPCLAIATNIALLLTLGALADEAILFFFLSWHCVKICLKNYHVV